MGVCINPPPADLRESLLVIFFSSPRQIGEVALDISMAFRDADRVQSQDVHPPRPGPWRAGRRPIGRATGGVTIPENSSLCANAIKPSRWFVSSGSEFEMP